MGAGRVLGSSLQQRLDQLTDEDPDLCCPVSLVVFAQPVIASDGFMYEQSSLMTLLRNRQVSPMTREAECRPGESFGCEGCAALWPTWAPSARRVAADSAMKLMRDCSRM